MTNSESLDLLKNNPLIDKILVYNLENVLRIQQEKFDILFALEIDTPSTLLANLVDSKEKFGYFFDNGATACFNKSAEAYLETAFLNHIKIQNRKTYQELIFEACELPYNKEKPIFNLTKRDLDIAKDFVLKHDLSYKKIIGINIGSASRWQSKFWGNDKIKQLIKKLYPEFIVIVLAGPNEKNKQEELIRELAQEGIFVVWNNPNNTINEFAAIINLCDVILCGDTLILHLALSLDKKTIALFFSTSPWEIEEYNNVKKIISPLLEKYFYVNEYIEELADSISLDEVLFCIKTTK